MIRHSGSVFRWGQTKLTASLCGITRKNRMTAVGRSELLAIELNERLVHALSRSVKFFGRLLQVV